MKDILLFCCIEIIRLKNVTVRIFGQVVVVESKCQEGSIRFWLKRDSRRMHCRSFCGTCPYFEQCTYEMTKEEG